MESFVGLDVSQRTTAVAIVNGRGEPQAELTVPTEPSEIAEALRSRKSDIRKIGLEAGALSGWLHMHLNNLGYPAVCIETARMSRIARTSPNKTDRSDAMAIAQAMRTNLYQPVHVKSVESARTRALLVLRSKLIAQAADIEAMLRGTLRVFGLKVGPIRAAGFADRVRELAKEIRGLRRIVDPALAARRHLQQEAERLTKLAKDAARSDPIARQFLAVPGIGPMTALAFRATIDDPSRFRRSPQVAAHLGLVPRIWESGETSFKGRVTRRGDALLRRHLFMAARNLLVNYRADCELKAWGLRIAERRGRRKAYVAVARKLATILFAMWRDGTNYNAGRVPA